MVWDGVFLHNISLHQSLISSGTSGSACWRGAPWYQTANDAEFPPGSITFCRSVRLLAAPLVWFANDNHLALSSMDSPT